MLKHIAGFTYPQARLCMSGGDHPWSKFNEHRWSNFGARTQIGSLSAILNHAVQDEKLTANPASGLLKATPGASKKTRIPHSARDVQNILGSKNLYRRRTPRRRRGRGGGLAAVARPAHWRPP